MRSNCPGASDSLEERQRHCGRALSYFAIAMGGVDWSHAVVLPCYCWVQGQLELGPDFFIKKSQIGNAETAVSGSLGAGSSQNPLSLTSDFGKLCKARGERRAGCCLATRWKSGGQCNLLCLSTLKDLISAINLRHNNEHHHVQMDLHIPLKSAISIGILG